MEHSSLMMYSVVVFLLVCVVLSVYFMYSLVSLSDIKENKVITFTFDDGYLNFYDVIYPMFEEFEYTGTVYIISGKVGTYFEDEELMNWTHIEEISSKGWEIGSHTLTHPDLTLLGESDLRYELEESKRILEDRGFEVRSLAIPYGRYDDEVRHVSEEYYQSVRPSSWGVNDLNNFDNYNIKSIWLTNRTELGFVKEQIDSLKDNEWLVFMIHLVNYNEGEYTISPLLMEEILEYIKFKDIKVKTLTEVVEKYG